MVLEKMIFKSHQCISLWSQTWLDQRKSSKDIKCSETIDSKIHREKVIGTCLDLNTYGKCDIAVQDTKVQQY